VGKVSRLRDLLERLLGIPRKQRFRAIRCDTSLQVKPIGIGKAGVPRDRTRSPLLEDLIPLKKFSHYTEGPPQRIVPATTAHVLRLLPG